jgi:hypothetical protein
MSGYSSPKEILNQPLRVIQNRFAGGAMGWDDFDPVVQNGIRYGRHADKEGLPGWGTPGSRNFYGSACPRWLESGWAFR